MDLRAVLAVACSLGLAGYQCIATRAPVRATAATPEAAIDINEARAMARMLEPAPFQLGAAANEPVTPVDDLPTLKRPGTKVIVAPPTPAPKARPSASRPAAKVRPQTAAAPRSAATTPRRTSSSKPAFQRTASPMTAALNRTFHSRPDFGLGTLKPRKPSGRAVRTISR